MALTDKQIEVLAEKMDKACNYHDAPRDVYRSVVRFLLISGVLRKIETNHPRERVVIEATKHNTAVSKLIGEE